MNADSLLPILGAHLLQVTLVLAAVGLSVRLFCRHRPHLAYTLWLIALAKCLVPPVWSSPTSLFSWAGAADPVSPAAAVYAEVGGSSAHALSVSSLSDALSVTASTAVAAKSIAPERAESAVAGLEDSFPLPTIGVWIGLWLVGCAAVGIGQIARTAAARRRVLKSAVEPSKELEELLEQLRQSLGVRRNVRLVVTREPLGPALVGLLNPVLALPDSLVHQKSVDELRPVLAHELIHLRRGDHFVVGAQLLCQLLWWFHPLVWWMNRDINRVRELSCDEQVIGSLRCEPASYAQMLLDVLRLRRQVWPAGICLGVSPMQVTTQRLQHIMSATTRFPHRTPWVCWLLLVVLSLVLLPGAGLAEAGEELTFEGSVVDRATGDPISGAAVTVKRLKGAGGDVVPFADPTQHVTDDQGHFQFTVPPEQSAEPALYLELDVSHPQYVARTGEGYGLALILKDQALGAQPWFSRLELDRGQGISGTVLDPAGQPVAGAEVGVLTLARADNPQAAIPPNLTFANTQSDEQGRFRMNISDGVITEIRIDSADHANLFREIGSQRGDIGTLQLAPGTRLSGRVLDVEGQPISGARIVVQSVQSGPSVRPVGSRSAHTDAEGRFALNPLQPGEYTLSVSGDGVPPFLPRKVLLQGSTTTIELRPIAQVRIRAQYVDSSGAPARGWDLYGAAFHGGHAISGKGDVAADGSVQLFLPRGGADAFIGLTSDVHSALRHRRGQDGPLSSTQNIRLGTLSEDVTDLYIVRYRAPVVIVRALGPDDEPIADFRPLIRYPEGTVEQLGPQEQGDVSFEPAGEGRLKSTQLLPDQTFTLTVGAEGYQPAERQLSLTEGEVREVDVQLVPAQ